MQYTHVTLAVMKQNLAVFWTWASYNPKYNQKKWLTCQRRLKPVQSAFPNSSKIRSGRDFRTSCISIQKCLGAKFLFFPSTRMLHADRTVYSKVSTNVSANNFFRYIKLYKFEDPNVKTLLTLCEIGLVSACSDPSRPFVRYLLVKEKWISGCTSKDDSLSDDTWECFLAC